MASQDKWYVNKDGVDIMDVIIKNALSYPEGRALKCIIKGDLDSARAYLTIIEEVRNTRVNAINKLIDGFDVTQEQKEMLLEYIDIVYAAPSLNKE